jgi:hypothetical protein
MVIGVDGGEIRILKNQLKAILLKCQEQLNKWQKWLTGGNLRLLPDNLPAKCTYSPLLPFIRRYPPIIQLKLIVTV